MRNGQRPDLIRCYGTEEGRGRCVGHVLDAPIGCEIAKGIEEGVFAINTTSVLQAEWCPAWTWWEFPATRHNNGGLICNDLWANTEWTPQADPHLTQQLARMDARVIFQSANSGLGEGEELLLNRQFHDANLRIRARSGHQWIVVADASDPANHRANQCQSGVLDPTGNWVVKAPPVGEQMFAQTIELADLASQGNENRNSAPPSGETVRFFVDPRTNSDDPEAPHGLRAECNSTMARDPFSSACLSTWNTCPASVALHAIMISGPPFGGFHPMDLKRRMPWKASLSRACSLEPDSLAGPTIAVVVPPSMGGYAS